MSSQHGLVPPPPGQTANFVDPPNRQAENIAVHTTMLVVATIFMVIRLYTRMRLTKDVNVDDYLCLFAYCQLAAYSALLIACGNYYLGRHLWDITLDSFIRGNRLQIAAQCVYLPLTASIKASCLVFYYRIFRPIRIMRWLCLGGVAFICAGYLAFLLVNIFGWSPIRSHWNPTIPHRSVPAGVGAYGSGALNVVTDLYVVVLPMPATWRLQMSLARKLRVMGLFALGFVAFALSVARLARTPEVFQETDPTWAFFTFSIYPLMELYIGLICACAMALASFVDYYGPVVLRSVQSYTSLLFENKANRSQSTVNGSNNSSLKHGMQEKGAVNYGEQQSVENIGGTPRNTQDERMYGNLQAIPTRRNELELRSNHIESGSVV